MATAKKNPGKTKKKHSRNTFIEAFEDENGEIADNLREVREDAEQTQQYMADSIGVSRSYIIAIENKKVRVPAFIVKEYCDVLDIPTEKVLGADYKIIHTRSGRRIRDLLSELPESLTDILLELIELFRS